MRNPLLTILRRFPHGLHKSVSYLETELRTEAVHQVWGRRSRTLTGLLVSRRTK